MIRRGALFALALLGGCAHGGDALATAAVATDWRRVATGADRVRLTRARAAWLAALAKARGAGAPLAREGALFDPDAALDTPVPPAGDYRCRTIKLGARAQGLLDYVAYPWFACRISGADDGVRLEKRTGSQRQAGRILVADARRAVFLGTLALGDERAWVPYGRDRARDVAGWVERSGPVRWRVAMPYPAYESVLDVLELVPAG